MVRKNGSESFGGYSYVCMKYAIRCLCNSTKINLCNGDWKDGDIDVCTDGGDKIAMV